MIRDSQRKEAQKRFRVYSFFIRRSLVVTLVSCARFVLVKGEMPIEEITWKKVVSNGKARKVENLRKLNSSKFGISERNESELAPELLIGMCEFAYA